MVVGGFQGVSYRRDITTLGRGGSDTTAVALAAALNAERCEIYSDVDGVYSADPSVVKDAKHLPEISYEQMQEMSEAGAKVLNAQAVQFAKEAQIAIYARSTFQQGRETIVRKFPAGISKGVKAVVYENDISRVEYLYGDDEKSISLLSFLEKRQIPVKEFNFSKVENENKISFLVSRKNIYNEEKLECELAAEFGSRLKIVHDFGTVSLIGDGINKDNTILLDTLNILRKEKIEVSGIATTSFRISFLLDKSFVKKTVLLCHNRWIEEKV